MLNNWGNLQWKYEAPSKKIIFLDLELELNNSSVTTRTFQKEMNLYLYIPPLSAHPPSCLKGLITGELRRYRLQNNHNDFQHILDKFILRLTERGHTIENLKPILEQAAQLLDSHPCRWQTQLQIIITQSFYIEHTIHMDLGGTQSDRSSNKYLSLF